MHPAPLFICTSQAAGLRLLARSDLGSGAAVICATSASGGAPKGLRVPVASGAEVLEMPRFSPVRLGVDLKKTNIVVAVHFCHTQLSVRLGSLKTFQTCTPLTTQVEVGCRR